MTAPERRFAKQVHSVNDLPLPVRDLIRQSQPDGSIQLIVTIPPDRYPVRRGNWALELPFGWRTTPERTVVFGQESITIAQANPQGELAATVISLADLIDIHMVGILLYAFVEFAWAVADRIETIRLEYNAVGDRLIWRGVDLTRAMFPPRIRPDPAAEPEVSLARLPMKFRNYLRFSLLPTERLLAAIYQPAIPRATRWFHSFISPNRALAITDRGVISIEDRHHQKRGSHWPHGDYAVIRHSYPLNQIERIAIASEFDLCWLRLRLGTGGAKREISIPLQASETERLRAAFCAHGIGAERSLG